MNYIIKQLLTIDIDIQLSPRSILVFYGGYHVISNTSIVSNCIILSSSVMTGALKFNMF